MKERADKLLAARGLAPSPEKAQALIMAGLVTSGPRRVEKPGELIDAEAPLEVAKPLPFVGRGGLKLEEALERVRDRRRRRRPPLDVGASTGGIRRLPVEAGRGPRLRRRRRYQADRLEPGQGPAGRRSSRRTPASLVPEDLPEPPDVVTMDVSFISVLEDPAGARGPPGRGDGRLSRQAPIRGRAEGRRERRASSATRPSTPRSWPGSSRAPARSASARPGSSAARPTARRATSNSSSVWLKGRPDLSGDLVPAWIKEASRHD